MLSRRFRSQPSGSRRLEQQERQHARLGAAWQGLLQTL